MNSFSKLKVYYDAEFTGLTKDTSLISIGLVSETGDYFYGEFTDYDESKVDDWLRQHVIDNLLLNESGEEYQRYVDATKSITMVKGESELIRTKLLQWFSGLYENKGKQIQIYTDCYAYDWVLLNDLICAGESALNIPKYIYYIPVDLCTLMQYKNVDPDITREDFISEDQKSMIMNADPFNRLSANKNVKHNSLWDAYIARECFKNLTSMI